MRLDHVNFFEMKKDLRREVKGMSLDSSKVRLWRALMACHEVLYSQFERNLSAKGLSYSRFQVLFYIHFNQNSSAVFLAEKMNVTRGNMSTFLKRMINDRLLVEIVEKNRKRVAYGLSVEGQRLFEKSLKVHLKEIEGTIPKFSESMIDQLNSITDEVSVKLAKRQSPGIE